MKPSKYHACATGDCRHDDVNDCLAAVLEHADELHGRVTQVKGDHGKAVRDARSLANKWREAAVKLSALTEALTPSGHEGGTKGEYHGEFSFGIMEMDEEGDEHTRQELVPWTVVKDIMKAIHERAARTLEETK